MNRVSLLLISLVLLNSCAVGPDYHRDVVDQTLQIPHDWHWQKANPHDFNPKGPWWELYDDASLNALEEQAMQANQDLKAAMSRVDQARALARIQGADFFPQTSFNPSYQRERFSGNNPEFKQATPKGVASPATVNAYSVPLDLSYEIDLWGRVRRAYESSVDSAQASAADYQTILLTLNADVAIQYFTLCEYDTERQILRETVSTREKSLEINKKRLQAGRATALDVEQAKTELANDRADLAQVEQNRAQTQDALAVLCGRAAPDFILPERPLDIQAPEIPTGLPASILERRPDIASAERTLASKNAEIGVAYAAFFPTVTLTGSGGYLSASASNVFNWTSSVWTLGPTISLPLFTGGRTEAQVKQARADYQEAVANYRESILIGFQDVEDALAARKFLSQRAQALQEAVTSSAQALKLSEQRYQVGQVNYFEVTDAQRTALSAQRAAAQIRGQLLYSSVQLIKALGGGWSASIVP